MKVVVLAGGTSGEREVSLRSGGAVAAALQRAKYDVEVVDPAYGEQQLLEHIADADVVFPALHGAGGEDGEIQKILEVQGVTYVGSDSQASALCFDKHRYMQLLRENGIAVPHTELVDENAFQRSPLGKQPYVLKPNDGGSSLDTFIVREPGAASLTEIHAAFARYPKMLLQELIIGTEITVAVLIDKALPVIEIIPPSGREFDYENKYNGATQELCPPKHVPQEQQLAARELALRIHRLTGCRDMSRTDIIIAEDNSLYALETNTIPGLTRQSLLPKAAQVAGYSMQALCVKLVEAANIRA